MPQVILLLFSLIISYLLGAIPTAYLFGKFLRGIDIRQHGSGNVGATNAFRVLGKGIGTVVLIVDILKGFLPTLAVANVLSVTEPWMRLLCGLAAVCGHNWSVFLNFKGGKGIATGFGLILGFACADQAMRPVLLLTLALWIFVFLSTGFVSLASILAVVLLPVWMLMTSQPFYVIVLGIVLCIFVVLRHRPNIKRLLEGQEHQVDFPWRRR